MTAYLIKSILCLLVLWGFYKIALEQTAAHHFKRIYLLGSLGLALTLPLITFSYTVEVEPQPVVAESVVFEPAVFNEAPVAAPVAEPTNWLLIGLGIVYVAGVMLFGFRFLRNLIRLRKKITSNEKVQAKSHINVLLGGKVIPHSFLKFIFLPKTEFKTNSIAPEILAHEQAHVTQKHTWDILAVEFLQVIFWFNPLLVFLKRSIALNHEFLADRAALAQNTTTENYIDLLFTYSGGAHHTALSSPINYSLTKKRILMLSKTQSVKKMLLRLVLFVPVLALCFYCFNQEIVAKPVVQKESPSILGKWVDREREFSEFTIYKEDKQLWMKFAKDTFFLQQEGKNQYTMIWKNKPLSAHKRISLSYKPENNELLLEDKSFIRPENSYRELFAGDWEGVEIDQKFYIRSENGGTIWTIKDQFGTNRYYPVLTSTGFYFTYGDKDIYFTVDGNHMTSSDGYTYKKIKEAPKIITVYVVNNRVSLISQSSSKDKLAEDLNAMTADWSPEDYRNYILDVKSQVGMDEFLKELNKEFKKTELFKINPSQQLIPPPAPAAPKSGTPPPPPPAPAAPKTVKSNKTSNKPVPEESEIIQVFEDIYIEIDKNHQVFINSKMIDSDRIEKALSRYNSDYTKAERAKVMDVKITVDPSVRMGIITDVKSALRDYGVKSIKVIIAGEPQEKALIPAESENSQNNSPLSPEQMTKKAGYLVIDNQTYYYVKTESGAFNYYDRYAKQLSEKEVLKLQQKVEKAN
ncbi:M56 family metallopeptidase [Leeuwenhoekiella sp. H156]|uniref:M56 family metallopeptidase n=1 Tax=Leeuwenhoekiella sp. H156 TaxID=3450128 RepID=UPI003FA467EE